MHSDEQREAATGRCASRAAGWGLALVCQVGVWAGDEIVGAGQGADGLDDAGGIANHDRLRRHVPRDHRLLLRTGRGDDVTRWAAGAAELPVQRHQRASERLGQRHVPGIVAG